MQKSQQSYQDQCVALATKHHKEEVLGPPLRAVAGVILRVPDGLDTDLLGTFSGEIPRQGPARDVAIRKAHLGMDALGLPLGLASEGSFGPHPQWMFIPADFELLAFVDAVQGITIVEQVLSTETNYAQTRAQNLDELTEFLAQTQFPSHGLVVRPDVGVRPGFLFKGIVDHHVLENALQQCTRQSENGLAYVETDMRAHMNPSRRGVLHEVAEALARRLISYCPACRTPGWGVTGVIRGLPCEDCGGETSLVRNQVYGCVRCDCSQEIARSDGIQGAQPQFCPWCNP